MKCIFQKAFSIKISCGIVIKIFRCVVSPFRGSPHGARIFKIGHRQIFGRKGSCSCRTLAKIMHLDDEALLIWNESCGTKIETDSTAKWRENNDTRKNKLKIGPRTQNSLRSKRLNWNICYVDVTYIRNSGNESLLELDVSGLVSMESKGWCFVDIAPYSYSKLRV